MRILWITHDLFESFLPYVNGKPSLGGAWIAPLFDILKNENDVILGSVTPVLEGAFQQKEIDGVMYYSVPIGKGDNVKDMSVRLASEYLRSINDFKPDIIHIHGTEKNFGLLRKFVDETIPIVCSIQGIVTPCYDALKFSISTINLRKYRSIKNRLGRGGIDLFLKKWKQYVGIEQEIYSLNRYFIGRTEWDKAQLKSLNPSAIYFHGEELLRPVFYSQKWELSKCERYRIFISSSANPIKGFHVLLKAVALLKLEFPDIKVVVPLATFNMKSSWMKDYLINEDYANYLKNSIIEYGLETNVIIKKRLSAAEMALEYSKAHVFVLSSFIENSPNSLGESMIMGVPSVASTVGGVPYIVKDNESSLLLSPGDHAFLAWQIRKIFSEDSLAASISHEAQLIAQKRHDVVMGCRQYLEIYTHIINQHHENIACPL
ncbi:MAG: glycosyltransferase family 4 protein [Proteiniphilum sp.]